MKTALRLLAILCALAGLLAFYMAIMCILKTGEYCDPALFSGFATFSVGLPILSILLVRLAATIRHAGPLAGRGGRKADKEEGKGAAAPARAADDMFDRPVEEGVSSGRRHGRGISMDVVRTILTVAVVTAVLTGCWLFVNA